MKFQNLPDTVLSAVLSWFCDGKSISTVCLLCLRDKKDLLRGILVERLVKLRQLLDKDEEIRDVLDLVREDVRLSKNDDVAIVTKLSRACAIMDYFEIQLRLSCYPTTNYQHHQQHYHHQQQQHHQHQHRQRRRKQPQWIVWAGTMNLPYGEIDAYLTTPFWTPEAMLHWRSMELSNATYAQPRRLFFDASQEYYIPYGTIFPANTRSHRRIMRQQCADLETSDTEIHNDARHALVPQEQFYQDNPSIILSDHGLVSRRILQHQQQHDQDQLVGPLLIGNNNHGASSSSSSSPLSSARSSLCCCWDMEQTDVDWQDAMDRLGENCIRVLTFFAESNEEEDVVEGLRESDYCTADEFSSAYNFIFNNNNQQQHQEES